MSTHPLKVVAFNGSPRAHGNTAILLGRVLARLGQEGVETELIQIGGHLLAGCTACRECFENQDRRCSHDDDAINACIAKMLEADAIILGSPTYFSDVSTEMKALIDRAGFVAKANQDMFRRKIGAAVVAVCRAGGIHVFNSINHFFLISQMIVPGSCYWNIGIGREPGEVEADAEGLHTMDVLGENIAWLLARIHAREEVASAQ